VLLTSEPTLEREQAWTQTFKRSFRRILRIYCVRIYSVRIYLRNQNKSDFIKFQTLLVFGTGCQ